MESSLGGILHLSLGLIDYADMTLLLILPSDTAHFETEGAGKAVRKTQS